MNYQRDIFSSYAKQMVPHILSAFENVDVKDKNLKQSLQLLSEWNFEMNKFSQTPAIFLIFFDKLMKNIYLDEMGDDLFNQYVFLANVPYRNVLELLGNQYSIWIDDKNTNEIESKNDIIRKSLVNALEELEKKMGENIKDWQWGRLHTVTFRHPFSGASGLLDGLIEIGPFEISGDGTTLLNSEYPFSESNEEYNLFRHDPFDCELGPSMRFIYDFAEPDEFYLILTTGQSGNILSDHYNDMTELWLEGKYMKIKTDIESIRAVQNKLLKLLPE
jgi:penicillin amidase